MKDNPFLKLAGEDRVMLGLCNMYPAAGIIEGMCPGWDFVWIDGQHGQHDYRSIMEAIRAAQNMGVASLVRVPGHEASTLGQIADLAPSAVMVPMVNTVEEAEAVVRAVRFPPRGARSYGGRRVTDLMGREFYQDPGLALVVQIETERGAHNAEAIAQVDGVDGLFFGPDDMKVSLGLPINASPTDNDRLRAAMQQAGAAAKNAGVFAACTAGNAAVSKLAVELGFQALVGGGDIAFMRARAAEQLAVMRDATGGQSPASTAPKSGGSAVYGG